MKLSLSPRARVSKGFGLLEVILVFAIVIGAAAVVFTVFQSARPSANAANEASNLSTIATNLKSTFGISHNYARLDTQQANFAGAIPKSMAVGTTAAESQWGPVTIGGKAATATKPSTFGVTYTSVPSDTCFKLVAGVEGFFDDINVYGKSVFVSGKPINSKILKQCAGASVVNIVFTGH